LKPRQICHLPDHFGLRFSTKALHAILGWPEQDRQVVLEAQAFGKGRERPLMTASFA
jgi:hypothetical protein